jgi:glycine/D-amino acid oxidase-like deaminating enzyme
MVPWDEHTEYYTEYGQPSARFCLFTRSNAGDYTALARIVERSGRIEAVETTRGRIATGTVVCAAGVWSATVAAMAGIDLPLVGERRFLHYTPEVRWRPVGQATPLGIAVAGHRS